MKKLFLYILLLSSLVSNAITYYISPTGDNSRTAAQAQNIATPWLTLVKAYSVMNAGDTVYARGGTYPTLSGSQSFSNRSGTAAARLCMLNYQLERPIFTWGGIAPGSQVRAFNFTNADFLYIRGFRITNLPQSVGQNSYNYGISMNSGDDNNIIENCEADHIGGTGIQVGAGCNGNLLLNCDSHDNDDPFSPNGAHENSNGYELAQNVFGISTTLRYCRAWWNGDDGFDGFNGQGALQFEGCWSFWNGYLPGTFTAAGDGNGWKGGPTPVNHNVVLRTYTNCLAFHNREFGWTQNFTDNNFIFQSVLYNCTAANNVNAGFYYGSPFTETNTIKNCLVYNNGGGGQAGAINSQTVQANNSWQPATGVTVTAADFQSVSETGMDGARQSNGALPVLPFMRLASGSDLINKGVNVGLPFCGTAPDLGCFELCAGNTSPLSFAGPDQSITLPTASVTMSGSGTDADGTIASYAWTQIAGTAATITTASNPLTTITGLSTAGSRTFRLTVTDNLGATATDDMIVLVNAAANVLPVANAGADKNITLPTNSVTQVGSGTDADGTITAYLWTQIVGPSTATITNATQATTNFNNLITGTYTFQLRVTDNSGGTNTDQMSVVVNAANIAPTANAGANQTITLPTSSVTLTGSGSDPDGTIASYAWVKVSGPAGGTITSATSAITTVTGYTNAGTYVYRLTVTDNQGLTGTSTTQVTVNSAPPPNQPPVVNAGVDRTITLPTNTINQVGSATDADGTVASYLWTKISGPTATIQTPTNSTTNFNNLLQGTYVFQLAATDNQGGVGTDQFTVLVNPVPNTPPIAGAGPDQVITLPTATATMAGTASDPGGSVASTLWTQIGGTASTITNSASLTTTITGLSTAGSRTYKLLVTDNLGLTASDTMIILVNPAANVPPVANAGADKVITLPVTTTSFAGSGTDADGTITAYLWTQISGTTATIVSATQASTNITNLTTAGVRVFQLRVTDNSGATATDQVTVTVNAALIPPTANAGANQSITLPTSSVTLTGTGTDPDGTISSYAWTKISGPAGGTITSPSSSSTTVTGYSNPGNYVYQLVVTDNNGLTGSSTTQITVIAANIPPTANAGANQTITLPTSSVTLSGSGSDPDGTIVAYAWVKISGPASGIITTPTTASTTVTGYSIAGTYVYRLTVTDNGGLTGSSTTQIIVNSAPPPNQPPVVNAGTDKVLTLPTNSVSQVGSATDPDGTVVSYLWTKISGPATSTINTPAAATTTLSNLVQGTYIFQLAATDNLGAVGTDQATVTVNSAPNIPPVANAGTDKAITLPTNSVTQVGSGTDADGTVTTYQWTKISGPATFNIVTPASSTTIINNLVAGTYIFQLQVTDNNSASGTDQMTIIVTAAPNTPPIAGAGPDQVITLPTATATMAGTASDPGGSVASILWTQIGGTASTITNSASLTTTITGLSSAGSRTYKLLVTDNLGSTASDTMIILVNPAANVPPVSNAGSNQTITMPTGTTSTSVTLTGSGTDADGTIISYLWSKVSGPTSSSIVAQSQAITAVNNLVYGVYNFNLRVTDNSGATANDQVQITIDTTYVPPPPIWVPPTANAGQDYHPIICVFCSSTSVTVTGSGNSDSGTIVSYTWTKISGPSSYTINSPNTASTIIRNLVRGTYVFQLQVADNLGYLATDLMTIDVRKNHIVIRHGRIIVEDY